MKLFNKTIDRQLFKQYSLGSDLSKQEVVVKIFNPQGAGSWYILNSDPQDPDYLWAIVDLGYGAEVGSVSRSDLETYRGRFGLGFERDLGFDPINAEELYKGLRQGKFYADGGKIEEYKPYVFYFYYDGNEMTFNTLEKALKEAKQLGAMKVRDNLGGEYFLNYADGGQVSGDEVTLSKGYGYYDLSKYAYGNDFKRFTEPTVGKFIKGTVKKGGQVRVLLNDGREIITDKQAIDLPTYDDKDELYQENKHLFSFGYADGGNLSRDRKFVNHSQDYEVEYSKGKNRKGYGFEDGGNLRQSLEQVLKQDVTFLKFDSGRAYDTFNRLDIPFLNVHDYDFNHYCIIKTENLEKVLNNVKKGIRVVKKKFSSDDLGFDYKGRTSFADGGEITEEDYEKRLQYLKMMKNNERSSFGKYNIDKEIRQINTILEHRKNFKNSYADGGGVENKIQVKNFADLKQGDVIRRKEKLGTTIFVVVKSPIQSRAYKNEYNALVTCIVSNTDYYKPFEEYNITSVIKYGKLGNVDYIGKWNYDNKVDYSTYLPKSNKKYADGGELNDFSDNQRMIMNQNVEVEHHHEELEDILEDKVPVPAWVVAKMETATKNLSDITHYLDGQKELMEDENEEDDDDDDDDEEYGEFDYSNLDDDEDEMESGEIKNKEVVEPINVTAETKAELTKKFTDDALGNLKGFLKGMEEIELRDDYTFDYKNEQFEIEPIINSDQNGVSNAVFTIFDGDGEEVGEVAYSREGGKQKFTANSQFFGWDRAKFEDGGFMNGVYAKGGAVTQEYYDVFGSLKSGFDLYKINGNEEEDVFIGNFKTIEDAEKKGKELGLEKRPMWLRYAKGGKIDSFIPNVGTIDTFMLKSMLIKNPNLKSILSDKEFEFLKNENTDAIGVSGKPFNTIITDGNQEIEFDLKKNVVVKHLTEARDKIKSHYSTNYAKGGEMNFRKDLTNKEVYQEVVSKVGSSVWEQNALNVLRNESLKNPNGKFKPTGDLDKLQKYLSNNTSYAKGGEIAKAEVFGLKRNIMGTTDIEMRISGMRKAQDFIVYPIGADDAGNVVTIQSETRIGQINLVKGVGVMSQSHSNGAYFVHLQMDKLTPFTISESDLENIKSHIFKTAGANVGSSVVKSDNSGASRLFADGGSFEKPFDVVYKTKSGRAMVAKRIMAKDEDEAKEKIVKQMRNSNTFEKVFMSYPSFADGGVLYTNQYFGKGYENEAIIELKKALPNHTFEKGKNSIVVDNGKFIIHLDLGNYGFIKAYSKEGSEGGISVTKISDAVDFIKDNQNFSFADGGDFDDEYDGIAYAKTKGKESVNWDKELREYVGSEYSKLTQREKEEIISDMQRDWDRSNSYAKGGVTYFNDDNQHRLSRPSGSFEKEIYAKVKDRIDSDSFVGSFGWKIVSNKKANIADGFLYKLDDYDQNLIKNLNLKQGEKVFRYVNRTTAIGGMMPFIKINIEKALLYFPVSNDNDDIIFETRGITPLWINLIEGSFADGGFMNNVYADGGSFDDGGDFDFEKMLKAKDALSKDVLKRIGELSEDDSKKKIIIFNKQPHISNGNIIYTQNRKIYFQTLKLNERENIQQRNGDIKPSQEQIEKILSQVKNDKRFNYRVGHYYGMWVLYYDESKSKPKEINADEMFDFGLNTTYFDILRAYKEKFQNGGFMSDVYAEGGQIRVGDRYKFNWTDTEGNKGYTIREVVKQNVTSGRDFRTKVMIMKVVESSMPETVGRMEEEYKPTFKKAIERGSQIPMHERKPRMADDYAKGGLLDAKTVKTGDWLQKKDNKAKAKVFDIKKDKYSTEIFVEDLYENKVSRPISLEDWKKIAEPTRELERIKKVFEEMNYAKGGSLEDKLTKLENKKSDLESKLLDAQLKANEKWNNMGWGSGMRKSKLNLSTSREDSLKERIKLVEKEIEQTKADLLPKKPKYILKADIKTVTVKRNGKEVTYEGADVLNGANVLAKGGDLTSKANYVAKRDVISVELKDGTTIKPVNGYWVKKGAEPIGAEPTPTSSSKSATKFGQTYIKKGAYGWSATTNINDFNDYDWRISTIKTSSGQLITSAKAGKNEQGDGYTTFKYTMYQDPYHTLEVSKPSRLTEKVVAEQHAKGVEKFKKFMETGMFKGGGKISNFDKLSAKVAKQYEGKPVKSQYQEEYGKYYSREEAQEVGDKVAGKVKAMQTDKKAFGGLFKNVKDLAKAKPKYPNLEGKQVPLKSGDFVMVFAQDDNTLSVMNVGKIGSGEKLRKIDISEVDITNFKSGGQTGTKKMNSGTETLKRANDLAKKIRMEGESWLDAKKRAFAELKK